MRTTVTELLRNFPKIRRAALAGERVVIETRDGDLVLMAEKPAAAGLFGAMSGAVTSTDLDPEEPGTNEGDWGPSL